VKLSTCCGKEATMRDELEEKDRRAAGSVIRRGYRQALMSEGKCNLGRGRDIVGMIGIATAALVTPTTVDQPSARS